MKAGKRVILVVDDEPETLKYVGMNLKTRDYHVLTASDGVEALKLFEEHFTDLVLLDIAMPGPDGLQVCKRLREMSDVPIVVLSARGRERDKVTALDLGADDYLTKPFGVEELLARVRAALRRSAGHFKASHGSYRFDDIEVDLGARRLRRHGHLVHLTPTEFSLLSLLVRNAGKVLTHRDLLHAVWGPEYREEKDYVWVYMRRLRSKLEDDPEKPRWIRTETGVGYRFTGELEAAETSRSVIENVGHDSSRPISPDDRT